MRALLLLPTYNESENLSPILESILGIDPSLQVLVIDDHSPDGTGALADQWAVRDRRVQVLHRPAKAGLGLAYLAGFAEALKGPAEAILQMDADFSHPVEWIPRLLQGLETYDFVLASRYIRGGGVQDWNLRRRLLSRGANFFARTVLGLPIRDLTGGFKAFRRSVVEFLLRCPIEAKGYQFQIETSARALAAGFRCCEVPFCFVERKKGVSKMSGNLIGEAFWRTLRLRKTCRQGTQKSPPLIESDRCLNTAGNNK